MRIFSLSASVFCAASFSATAFSSQQSCSDFSGTWVSDASKCTGVDPSSLEFEAKLEQNDCVSIELAGSGTLPLDGVVRALGDGITGLGTWDRNLYPRGDHLRIEAVAVVPGVRVSYRYLFSEEGGKKVLNAQVKRYVVGLEDEAEVLADCRFERQ